MKLRRKKYISFFLTEIILSISSIIAKTSRFFSIQIILLIFEQLTARNSKKKDAKRILSISFHKKYTFPLVYKFFFFSFTSEMIQFFFRIKEQLTMKFYYLQNMKYPWWFTLCHERIHNIYIYIYLIYLTINN